MFDKEREVVIITLKCGTRSHFLNELFPCCRKLRHANKIYVKKKYSDTCLLLWGNERRGMKILKEFYKDVHQPQLNRGTQRWFPPKIIESTFQAIQTTFRSEEIHFKRHHKICICSFILGQLQSFRNYKGFSIFSKKKSLDAIQCIIKVTIFLIPLSITFFNPKIFGFLLLAKNSPIGE